MYLINWLNKQNRGFVETAIEYNLIIYQIKPNFYLGLLDYGIKWQATVAQKTSQQFMTKDVDSGGKKIKEPTQIVPL